MALKIAVDFDGTLTKGNYYPEIGPELREGIEYLKLLKSQGVKIYLDTMRSGKELEEAIEWCRERGLEFDSVGPHRSQKRWTNSCKTHADYSIDDRNIGTPLKYTSIGGSYVDWPALIEIFQNRLEIDGWLE